VQEFKESDRKRTEDTKKFWEGMHTQLEQDRTEIRAEFEATRAQDKADTDAQINELRNLFESRQAASTSASDADMPESSNVRSFRH
jgi:hypothetical protein